MKALAILFVLGGAVWGFAACDDSSGVHETTQDGGPGQDSSPPPPDGSSSGGDGTAPQDCFTNPQSHVEIINACTDSQQFDKNPSLPLLLADGGLPPLP